MFLLQTPRLILRSHSLENAALLHQWFNDPELGYYDGEEQEQLAP
jgi:RimJ/RimL family protein N-acetyltransferase